MIGEAQKATDQQIKADQEKLAQLQQKSQKMQSEYEEKNREIQSHLDEAKGSIVKLEGEVCTFPFVTVLYNPNNYFFMCLIDE